MFVAFLTYWAHGFIFDKLSNKLSSIFGGKHTSSARTEEIITIGHVSSIFGGKHTSSARTKEIITMGHVPTSVVYNLSYLPAKMVMENGRPPSDAILNVRRGAIMHCSNVRFVAYTPSMLEQKWIDNVRAWQDDLCSYTSDADIAAWLGAVRHAMLEPTRMLYVTNSSSVPPELRSMALSAFTYSATLAGHSVHVHVPIEPTASIARDPRKCWEPRTERYTQSKDHLLPLSLASAVQRKSQRAYLFDAGATIPTGGISNGWTGTTWLWGWYASRGIVFDKVFAWEPRTQVVNTSLLLPAFAKALVFNNRGCVGEEGHPDNPLTVIMQYCRPEDLCIFKLDIDTSSAELAINSQLLKSPQIMAVVDEYYFEHHVKNQVMAIHGALGGRPTRNINDLRSWYTMATHARRQGMRMHFWP